LLKGLRRSFEEHMLEATVFVRRFMLQFWKARRGRKAATALITPFVERSRVQLGGIPDFAWQDAYLVGFIAMLATLEAREEAGSLRSYALGLVQSRTLAELSCQPAAVVGETICALSMEQDGWFAAGCRDASKFHAALHQYESVVPLQGGGPIAGLSTYPSELETELYELWKEHFEARIAFISEAFSVQ